MMAHTLLAVPVEVNSCIIYWQIVEWQLYCIVVLLPIWNSLLITALSPVTAFPTTRNTYFPALRFG